MEPREALRKILSFLEIIIAVSENKDDRVRNALAILALIVRAEILCESVCAVC